MTAQKPNYLLRLLGSIIIILLMTTSVVGCKRHTVNVLVNGSIEYQTIDGWGIVHYIARDWEGPNRYPISEQDVMYQIKDLGINYVRNFANDFLQFHEKINDDNDPFHYNWNSYNALLSKFGYVFERLQYQEKAGLKYDLSSHAKPKWMGDHKGNFDSNIPNCYDELAEYWDSLLIYAKKNYGLTVPYINLQIEPSFANQQSGWMGFTPTELKEAIKAVGIRLREKNLSTIIIAPDEGSCGNTKNTCQIILADPVAKKYINNIAYHAYDGFSGKFGPDKTITAMTSLANDKIVKNSGLSLWMTEWTLAWAYGDRMRDWVDTLRLALDFAKMVYNTHVYGNTSLFVIWTSIYDWGHDVDNNGIMENEGIFGPGVTDGKLNLKKYGHALSQYTKYIPPGSKRIDASLSGASNVFATAYKNMKTGIFTIVFINKNASTINLNIDVKDIPGLTNLKVIRTSSTENSAELGTIALSDSSFTTALRDSSVTTFTGNIKIP